METSSWLASNKGRGEKCINKTVVFPNTEITGLLANHLKKILKLNYITNILFQLISTILPLFTANTTELVSGRAEGCTQPDSQIWDPVLCINPQ